MQNDFADPDGSLYVSGADEVIDVVEPRGRPAPRPAGALVVTTQDWHPPVTPHFAKDGGTGPSTASPTPGAPPCTPASAGQAHGVQGRRRRGRVLGVLDGAPHHRATHADRVSTTCCAADGIERVVVVGLATDYCVKETALDALRLGYDTTVVLDGIRPVELEPGDGQQAVDAMAGAGVALG